MAAATGKISAIVAGKRHRIRLVFRLQNYSIGFIANRQYPLRQAAGITAPGNHTKD